MLSGGGARAAYQVGVLRYLAREFPPSRSRHPDRRLGRRHQRGVPRRAAGAVSGRRSSELARDVERPPHRPGLPRRLARPGVAQRCAGAAGWCPAASRRCRTPRASSTPRRCAKCSSASCAPDGGPIPGIQTQPRGRLAARVRAHRIELHHRPVDHVGADARRLRDAVVGAAAAQEPHAARCASIT